MNRRFATYYLALLLGGLLQATICFAENADVTYTVWHGRRGTGEYANFDRIDPSYIVVGPRVMDFPKTPSLSRTDLTQYSVLSGLDGDATKVLFQYTPTADFPLFYLYFAIEEYGGFGGHVYPYTSIHIYEGVDTIGCSFYNEYTENGVKDGFIFDSQASFLQYYRPWDVMVYDLSAYIGKTLTIEVVATCCSNHYCWTHLYTAFEKARVEDVCGNCDENRLVAPAYSDPVWRKGSATGPMISGDEIFTITQDMVDDYYCTLSTYCGQETFLLGAAMDVISDFSYRTYCYNDNDTVFLTNNSYILYRTSQTRVPCDTALWTIEGGETSTVINLPYIVFPKAGKYPVSLRMGSENFKCDSTITKEVPFGLQNYVNLVDSICQEDLPYRWRDKEYRLTGDYTDTISASTGCDSVLHLLLTVLDTTVSTTTYTICEGETITWNGKKYSAAGTYRDTLVNKAGCDSLLTLNLKYKSCSEDPPFHPIDPMPFLAIRDTLDTTICVGDTLIWHEVPYTRDTIARDTGYYSWYPLDSVYWVLILQTTDSCPCDTMRSVTDDTLLYTILQTEGYLWFDSLYYKPGIYTDTIRTIKDCDSIGTLILRARYADSIKVCEPDSAIFTTPWGDIGVPHDSTCIDTILLRQDTIDLVYAHLCVTREECACDTAYSLTEQTIQEKEDLPFFWNGMVVSAVPQNPQHDTTLVYQTLKTDESCDSIATLHLIVSPYPGSLTIIQTLEHFDYDTLQAKPYVWQFTGEEYTEPGFYADTIIADKDTTTGQLLLTVDYTRTVYSCEGQTVDSIETPWGKFGFDTCTCLTGCLVQTEDSLCIVDAQLCVVYLTADTVREDTTLCYGTSIEWHGITVDQTKEYEFQEPYSGPIACDSVVYYLNAIVKTEPQDAPTVTAVCAGEVYTWNTYRIHTITAPGTYYDTLRTADLKCDSIHYTLTLTHKAHSTSDTTAIECTSFTWHGIEYTTSGDYEWKTINAAGCDSTRTLHLTINLPTTSDTTAVECTSFIWHGTEYTISGDYEWKTVNTAGCDSTRTLHLTINQPTKGDTTAYICFYDLPYIWHGNIAQDSDMWMTTNAAGCDSTVYLHLVVSPEPQTHTADTALCQGDMIEWHQQQITSAGTYRDTARITMGNGSQCDSIWYTLSVKVNPTYNKEENRTICDKQIPYIWNGIVCEQAGDYVLDSLTKEGCDSIVTLHLFVDTYSASDTSATICRGELPYLWHGKQLEDAGTLKDTLVNSVLCDSIVTLTLTLNEPTKGDTTAYICYADLPFIWHGSIAQDSDIWMTKNAAGCDSTIYLHLVVSPEPQTNNQDTAICQGDMIEWHQQQITSAGIYRDTARVTMGNGLQCDSIWYTLTVTLNLPTTSDTTAVECVSFTWHGTEYTTSGNYEWHTTNAAGCDSTRTLHLTINQPTTSDTTAVECTSFIWHEVEYTTSGDYEWKTVNTAGCDSTRTLHLTINQPTTSDTTAIECASFTWHGTEYTTSGDYEWKTINIAGCDSTRTLHLTINQPTTSDTTAVECTSFTWHEIEYTTSGDYEWHTTNAAGCDSTRTLHLTINQPTTSDTTAVECVSFTWHGTEYTTSGDYEWKTINAAGCDSTRTLHLTINQPTTSDTTAVECTSFIWHGTEYTTSGNYEWHTTNASGCDSTRTLHLTINQPTTSDTTAIECTSFIWHGTEYTISGNYEWHTTNAAGCDSTRTLHLTVNQPTQGDTTAVATRSFTWYGTTYTSSGDYQHTLVNSVGCDSLVTLHLTIIDVCQPLRATIHVPDICADARAMDIMVQLDSGTIIGYTVHYQNAVGNTMPFRDTTILVSPVQAQTDPVLLTLPVPYDPANRQRYPRPDEYRLQLTLLGSCPDTLTLDTTTFQVYYPSWLLDQHWDDVIALLNDRHNGGYTFSKVEWLRDGEVLPGEDNLYIYLPHQLWTNPEHQHQNYAYQALLTRSDDGKTILSCPMIPYHIDSTNVLTEPYVAVTPTLVPKENPIVHIQTNTTGTYWLYSATGKLLQTADYEPCEHEVFDILLPYQTQTMYILVFTPRNETKPLQNKYRVVKLLLE